MFIEPVYFNLFMDCDVDGEAIRMNMLRLYGIAACINSFAENSQIQKVFSNLLHICSIILTRFTYTFQLIQIDLFNFEFILLSFRSI